MCVGERGLPVQTSTWFGGAHLFLPIHTPPSLGQVGPWCPRVVFSADFCLLSLRNMCHSLLPWRVWPRPSANVHFPRVKQFYQMCANFKSSHPFDELMFLSPCRAVLYIRLWVSASAHRAGSPLSPAASLLSQTPPSWAAPGWVSPRLCSPFHKWPTKWRLWTLQWGW